MSLFNLDQFLIDSSHPLALPACREDRPVSLKVHVVREEAPSLGTSPTGMFLNLTDPLVVTPRAGVSAEISEHSLVVRFASDFGMPEEYSVQCDILPLWLALKGALVLHGAAVVSEHGVIVVIGDHGIGKSSLAMLAHHAGKPVVSDDTTTLFTAGPRLSLLSYTPWITVCHNPLLHHGLTPIAIRSDGKAIFSTPYVPTSPPVTQVICLSREGKENLTRLRAQEAVPILESHIRFPELHRAIHRRNWLAPICAVAQSVGVYTLSLPHYSSEWAEFEERISGFA